MAQNIWLVRHGHRQDFAHPEWFETAIRRYDPPLSEQGFKQVKKLGQRLATEKIDHLFCSPFLRAIQTAYPLSMALNLPIKLEKGLGEWLNPEWMTEYPKTEPEASLRKNNSIDWGYCSLLLPVYPETEAEMMARMAKTVELLLEQFTGNLLLVGHGATVEGVAAGLLGKNVILTAPVASLSKLVYEQNQWRLSLQTDTSFL
ncbi:MAG: histidine phosphatase family protein [Microcystaceae cyanobacterium]